MKIYKQLQLILLVVMCILIFVGCSSKKTPAALYITKNSNSIIDVSELNHYNITVVNSLANTKKFLDTKDISSIIIDESIIDDEKEILELQPWVRNQKNKLIVIVGYSNPSYCFFKKLDITKGKNIPKFSSDDYDKFKNQKGFCVAYFQENGQINAKAFANSTNINKIMEIVDFVSNNIKEPQKIEKFLGE